MKTEGKEKVLRKIVEFHQDEEHHWVADLDCGHAQHTRHDPPFFPRPWVLFQATLQTASLWAEHLYRNRLKARAIGATPTAQGDWLTEEGSLIQGKRQNSHQAVAHHGPFHSRFKQ
jgi:Protein of unknown function (DUF3565)